MVEFHRNPTETHKNPNQKQHNEMDPKDPTPKVFNQDQLVNIPMTPVTKTDQDRMSLTFTSKDKWIKSEIEREVELNPYWTKTGYVKHALVQYFASKKNARHHAFSQS